jgi:hypothetical protein
MDRDDLKLLNKQLEHMHQPPRHEGTMMLAITAVFLAGVTVGGFLFAQKSKPPMQTASTEMQLSSIPPDAPAIFAR